MHLGFLDCPIGLWVQSYSAWRNPALSGSLFHLLLGSWQQEPCATLPDDDDFLCALSELPMDTFLERKAELFGGFAYVGGRWACQQLVNRAQLLASHHAESLSRMAASVTATVLAPELFSLHMDAGADQVKLRKRRMPEGFSISQKLLSWGCEYFGRAFIAQGATRAPSERESLACLNAILVEMRLDAASNNRLYLDWDAAFMNFATRQTNGSFGMCHKYMPKLFPTIVTPILNGGRSTSFATRRDKVAQSADDALSGALGMIGAGPRPDMVDINTPLRARNA